jgi:hypothetical protein
VVKRIKKIIIDSPPLLVIQHIFRCGGSNKIELCFYATIETLILIIYNIIYQEHCHIHLAQPLRLLNLTHLLSPCVQCIINTDLSVQHHFFFTLLSMRRNYDSQVHH